MKKKKLTFDIPFVGFDSAEEHGWEFDVLIGKTGNPIIGIKIKNGVEQYSADPEAYDGFHQVLKQVIAIIGENRIIQKLDIFSKRTYTAEPFDHFLQQKYSDHFNGREYKVIETLLLFTDEITKKYTFTESRYKDLRDRCQKVLMLLEQNGLEPRFLMENDFEHFLSGILSMNFSKVKSLDNIQSNDEYLKTGESFIKTLSLVDVENIDLPSEMSTHGSLKGRSISTIAVDNFSFLNDLENYQTVIYNQIISIPAQAQQQRELERKKKKHEGVANNAPSNAIVAQEIADLLHTIASDGQLIVNAHFSVLFSTNSKESLDQVQSYLENMFFTKGIIVSKNAFNQLELYRSALPGNATELKDYDLFLTTSEAALCFFFKETYPIDEESDFYLRFTDRQGVPIKVDLSDVPMQTGRISNRNKFVLGPSGSGKSFLMNDIVEQYLNYNYDVVIVDTGDSYSTLCKYKGGRYVQYTEENPITMNPFNLNEEEFNIEKIEFLTNLIFLIWQGADSSMSSTEKTILDNILLSYYHQFYKADTNWYDNKETEELISYLEKFSIYEEDIRNEVGSAEDAKTNSMLSYKTLISPENWIKKIRKTAIQKIIEVESQFSVNELSFNGFYEYCLQFLPLYLKNKKHRISDSEFNIRTFLLVLKDFYKGGRYEKTLNESADETLFEEPFIVFEIDNIKDNPKLFPIVTLIIMDTFIQKMRLRHRRKALIIEEAWKAIASKLMGGYILYLYKTVRKFWGEAIVVTQELDDIIGNTVVKDSIINNSESIILLDQTRFKDNFDRIASLLSLNKVEQNKIFTINNLDNKLGRGPFKEFYIKRGAQGEVYGNEVSLEQYFTYTTEKPEKTAVEYYVKTFKSFEKAMKNFISDFRDLGEVKSRMVSLVNEYKKPLDSGIIETYKQLKIKSPEKDPIKAIKKELAMQSESLNILLKSS